MLAPRLILFTPAELLGSPTHGMNSVSEALGQIEKRGIPIILSTRGTRAQLELLRRKIGHGHPFITESGGGLFLPDGYFALKLPGASRAGRYLYVPFGRSAADAAEAIEEIAKEADAQVVSYRQMSAREISRNAGISEREAEASRAREFSERFFFAGNAGLAGRRFQEIARQQGWEMRPCEPFRELYSGNDAGKALRYLMRLYRQVLRSRVRSVALGASAEDAALLAGSDQAFVLPVAQNQFDERLAVTLPHAVKTTVPGAAGWNQIILDILARN